jgi:negative regulator of flagellin synthesis FlgM
MYINPKSGIGPDVSRVSRPEEKPERQVIQPVPATTTSTDRSDRVEISDAGRALAARDGQPGRTADGAALDPARAQQIRDRVLSGAYDTLEVVDAVARRLLASGDL